MTTGFEGVGEAVTGGLIARAVEPEAGEAGHQVAANCLNCGAPISGAYCSRCGQKTQVHRTVSAFWHDFLHSVLHFDGKIWRTLPLLVWRPGELTRRYIAGERANFVSPVALFLFSVFLMFAVFSLVGGPFESSNEVRRTAVEEAGRDFVEDQARQRERLQELRAQRQERVAEGRSTENIDADISEIEAEMATANRVASSTRILAGPGLENAIEAAQADAADGDGQAGRRGAAPLTGAPTGIDWIDSSIRKAQKNPELVAYKLQTNAYKFSWLLIPLSVPFVWLLFLHRRRYRKFGAYDHVVFVTYSITFMSLGLIALSLLRPIGIAGDLAELAMVVVPPIHIYRHLKGAYSLTRGSALWRTFLLVIFAFIAITMFVSLLLGIGGT